MILFHISLFILAITIAEGKSVKDEGTPKLSWPKTYTVQAVRLSLTAHSREDYQMWRTKKASRIDYNDGAVKEIIVKKFGGIFRNGYKYEIHPITTEEVTNQDVCTETKGSRFDKIKPRSFLPSFSDFEEYGAEVVNDKNTTKFVYREISAFTDERKSLWVALDEKEQIWIPVRYEKEEFNSYLGYKDTHEIWNFYDFSTDVDNDVFNIDDYNCTEEISAEKDSLARDVLFFDDTNDKHTDRIFEAYKHKFNRKYENEHEHKMRKHIFRKNLRLVSTTNRKNLGYTLTINEFSDLTPEEIKKREGLLKRKPGNIGSPFPYTEEQLTEISETLPTDLDLRLYGLVGPVKNQETCGSCWTFGTTAAVEGALARINGGKLLTLANQALVDCAWGFDNFGCDGGTDTGAYQWMMKHGLPTEAEYGTYANQDGYCRIENMTEVYPISAFIDVTPNSINALKVALMNHGPLSVSVDASYAFQQYSNGIFYDFDCDPTSLNHEVTLVGYGERDGEFYWIIRNSWGPTWGIDGYMHISARDNACGISTEPSYVVF